MSETQTLGFQIHGEYLTEITRERVLEGRWDHAYEILLEGLPGITAEQVFSILRGDAKLEGVNDVDLVPDDDQDYKQRLRYIYAGCYVTPDGRYMRPYAVITSWGREDIDWEPDTILAAHSDSRYSDKFGIGSRRMRNRDYAYRSLFYADDPYRDILRIVPLPKNYAGLKDGVLFGAYDVLFKEVRNYPVMLVPYASVNDAATAVKEYIAAGRLLIEDGNCERYGSIQSAGPTMRPTYEEPSEEEAAAAEAKIEQQFEEYRKLILEQAAGDFIELSYEEKNGEKKTLQVPRAPFEQWALESRNLAAGHELAAPWTPVSPMGVKMMNDDPNHTDWLIGAGLDPRDWVLAGDNAMQNAAQDLMFDVQRKKLNFKCHVLAGHGYVTGKVVHIEPGKGFEGRGQIGVIRNAGPDYVFAAQEAIDKGFALITETGGAVAHLVTAFLDKPLMLVRVPKARELYLEGRTVSVDCNEGSVQIRQRYEHD